MFEVKMRLLYVTSEVFPLAKTGGLADVSAALPAALNEFDVDVQLLMPGYRQAIACAANLREVAQLGNFFGCGETRLLTTRLPQSGIQAYLVDCPPLYDRFGGIYQAPDGEDWRDNAVRFALLNQVGALIADGAVKDSWRPDVVHSHDWHAAILPLLMSLRRGPRPATVQTIHNLAYQGLFDPEEFGSLGLPRTIDAYGAVEFYGQISFLKAGIGSADAITTVSPTYAREILTAEYGCRLDGLLRKRANRLHGIMNGADYDVWDPAHDAHLVRNYTWRHPSAKRDCKLAVQEEMRLKSGPEMPLIAFTSRLAHQKMPDVVLEVLPVLLEEGIQFALVADGDESYASRFRELAAQYPEQVAVRIGYEEPLAHRVLAGADILLHPSRYEPCGLAPIYAMRYGTLPIVRRVGGTADSIVDAELRTIRNGTATGFAFDQPTACDLIDCLKRALLVYQQPISWRKVQSSAMRQDFGWKRSAEAYAELYRSLIAPAVESEFVVEEVQIKQSA
jgi:starch synthase